MELGIYSFGETDPRTANDPRVVAQRVRDLVEEIELADQVGLDVFGVGEHHRPDYVVSAPAVILAAAAARTSRIRLTSAVTILSTVDPVREFENFATLDLLSDGRAEIIAGRGAFVESFPLFGYDLNDYDQLFPEKLDLLLKLNQSERITWQGRFRSALENADIAPRPAQNQLPIWIGVGGTPQSVVRAATLGLPMMLGIIGGAPAQFAPLMDLYRSTGMRANHNPAQLKTGVTSYLHLAKNSQEAIDEFYPYHSHYFEELGRKRGRAMQISRADYQRAASLEGAYFVGSPQQIIDKLLYQHELFGHQRFMAQIDIGGLPFNKITQTIDLLANEVAPVVRRETAKKSAVKENSLSAE